MCIRKFRTIPRVVVRAYTIKVPFSLLSSQPFKWLQTDSKIDAAAARCNKLVSDYDGRGREEKKLGLLMYNEPNSVYTQYNIQCASE